MVNGRPAPERRIREVGAIGWGVASEILDETCRATQNTGAHGPWRPGLSGVPPSRNAGAWPGSGATWFNSHSAGAAVQQINSPGLPGLRGLPRKEKRPRLRAFAHRHGARSAGLTAVYAASWQSCDGGGAAAGDATAGGAVVATHVEQVLEKTTENPLRKDEKGT